MVIKVIFFKLDGGLLKVLGCLWVNLGDNLIDKCLKLLLTVFVGTNKTLSKGLY